MWHHRVTGWRKSLVAAVSAVAAACCFPAEADINVEFRPVDPAVAVGDTVRIGVYVVSDSPATQFLAATEIIVAWDPAFLQLTGSSQVGATPLLASAFPVPDPYGLNEANPPQDGMGVHVAFANFGSPVPATPAGTLLTTLTFEALAPTSSTPVTIVPTAGSPPGHTIVFDAFTPNTDVTGSLQSTAVAIGQPVILSLDWANPSGPINPGQLIVMRVSMQNLGLNQVAGFQAFLEFDTERMSFVNGSYTPSPFGLPIITPINAAGPNIDLASGIDASIGQTPTSTDAVLAELRFTSLVPHCSPEIRFRAHTPPTRLTDAIGLPILPLTLIAPRGNCNCDFNCDGFLNSQDFFDFVTVFFLNQPRADYNMDSFINSQDFFDYLVCFFTQPPPCNN